MSGTSRRFLPQRGATLVEVLLAIALSGIVLPVMAGAFVSAHAGRATATQTLQASSLLREAQEATRSVREKGWSNVNTNGTYHPTISGSAWTLTSGSETINGFTRQIVISSVLRSASGAIVGNGGTVDPNTKSVVVTVSWSTPTNSSVSATTYLSRWLNNAAWTQTTQADFTGGTLTNTCASSTCAGLSQPNNSVQLQDLPATWQSPSTYGSFNIAGNGSGLSVTEATINSVPYAFVGYATGMAIVNVSNPASPTLTATFATTAAVNSIFINGTNAFLATASTTAQFVIVNISNPAAPSQTSATLVGDTGAALDVVVSGNYAYIVKKSATTASVSEFYIYNVSNPTSPLVSGLLPRLRADINAVAVSGNFAYVATAAGSAQFEVINVTNKTAPTSAATVNLGATANDITVNGTTVYIGTANNTTTGELRIFNITTPTSPTSLGTYEVGANVNGIGLDSTNPNYVMLTTAIAAKQAIAVSVANPAAPTLVNNITLSAAGNKVYLNGSFAYVGTADTTKELTIIYTGYRPNGSFESSTFDAGANAGFNYLTFSTNVPAGTTLTFQIAANNTGSGWTYVGPDGTANTTYAAPNGSASIPLSLASNRYFRYKASFTPSANGQLTAVINDVSLNYSP